MTVCFSLHEAVNYSLFLVVFVAVGVGGTEQQVSH